MRKLNKEFEKNYPHFTDAINMAYAYGIPLEIKLEIFKDPDDLMYAIRYAVESGVTVIVNKREEAN